MPKKEKNNNKKHQNAMIIESGLVSECHRKFSSMIPGASPEMLTILNRCHERLLLIIVNVIIWRFAKHPRQWRVFA
jgi:hypothetical protein